MQRSGQAVVVTLQRRLRKRLLAMNACLFLLRPSVIAEARITVVPHTCSTAQDINGGRLAECRIARQAGPMRVSPSPTSPSGSVRRIQLLWAEVSASRQSKAGTAKIAAMLAAKPAAQRMRHTSPAASAKRPRKRRSSRSGGMLSASLGSIILFGNSGVESSWRRRTASCAPLLEIEPKAMTDKYAGSDWIERLGQQYGARQAAALRGDSRAVDAADFWLKQIADGHWHEILAALRRPPLSEEQPHGTTVKP